jgi:hypothetical protein
MYGTWNVSIFLFLGLFGHPDTNGLGYNSYIGNTVDILASFSNFPRILNLPDFLPRHGNRIIFVFKFSNRPYNCYLLNNATGCKRLLLEITYVYVLLLLFLKDKTRPEGVLIFRFIKVICCH